VEVITNSENMFTNDFREYEVVGFHATSSLACKHIEVNGFLPDKILSEQEHARLISIATSQDIDTKDYEAWLRMRSVTFTIKSSSALNHVKQRNSGGQGLKNIDDILRGINRTTCKDAEFLDKIKDNIEGIRSADPVIYAVNLSHLGRRLVTDNRKPFYYVYWDTTKSLPDVSEVAPTHIIAKLLVQL